MSIGNSAPAWPSVIVSNGGISPSDHNRLALVTPGALDPLCFNRHFPPFQTVTQVFYNTCVTAVKRPLFPLGGARVELVAGGAPAAPPPCTTGCYQLLSPAVAVLCDYRGGRGARCVSVSRKPSRAPYGCPK